MPKLRTMKFGPPFVATHLLNDTEQLRTPAGSFLRKTSSDELLILIIVGLDIEYIERQSHCFYMCILWLTFLKAACGDGMSH
jgi:lipopolysaccharide/colanic/teichoic acid biosynthesis glycosyltransferase